MRACDRIWASTGLIRPAIIWAGPFGIEVVGRLLRDIPQSQRPFIFTKCGHGVRGRIRMAEPQRTLKPDSIRRECEASLRPAWAWKRIDLYQFSLAGRNRHRPLRIPGPRWWELIEGRQIVRAGRSCRIFDVNLPRARCEKDPGHVEFVCSGRRFSLINRFGFACQRDSLVRKAARPAVICATARCNPGLLTDSFFARPNRKSRSGRLATAAPPTFKSRTSAAISRCETSLQPIATAATTLRSRSPLAIAWTARPWPGVTGAIVGGRRTSGRQV